MPIVPMQCAWCRHLYDDGGNLGDPLPTMLPETSGGVCHLCVDQIFRQETERADAVGRHLTAVHLERDRHRLRRDLARERRAVGLIRGREHVPDPVAAGYVAEDQSVAVV